MFLGVAKREEGGGVGREDACHTTDTDTMYRLGAQQIARASCAQARYVPPAVKIERRRKQMSQGRPQQQEQRVGTVLASRANRLKRQVAMAIGRMSWGFPAAERRVDENGILTYVNCDVRRATCDCKPSGR